MKFLIAEDNSRVAKTIRASVRSKWRDADIATVTNGSEVSALVKTESPDMVILDLTLPGKHGIDVLEEIRTFSKVPIIIVSGSTGEASKVRGLNVGADDYLVKPFSTLELMARIEALFRRVNTAQQVDPQQENSVVEGDGLRVELAKRRVFAGGREVHLTPVEWKLLEYFVQNMEHVVSHQELSQKVWGTEHLDPQAIRVYIHRLRTKLGDNAEEPRLLRSHRGLGYVLTMSKQTNGPT